MEAGARVRPTTRPRFLQLDPIKVAAVHARGPLRSAREDAVRALYSSLESARATAEASGRTFETGRIRARFPDAQRGLPESWRSTWAVSVPDDVKALPQLDRHYGVEVEVWVYGLAAELLHEGPIETKPLSIARLQEAIVDNGSRIAGWREEEYLGTGPHGPRIIIRYPII